MSSQKTETERQREREKHKTTEDIVVRGSIFPFFVALMTLF